MLDIEGAEKLVERFGHLPVFHDSEVLSVSLDRDTLAATFTLLVPEFKEAKHIGDFEVVLEFFDVENFGMGGFNYQNVVSSLTFETVVESTEYSKDNTQRIHVDLSTLFGLWAKFSCSRLKVQNIESSSRSIGAPSYLRRDQ